jgi:transposase
MVRALYAIEKQAAGLSASERVELRRSQSAPALAQLREKLLLRKEQLLPKHPMAEAINYALSQWQELTVFCSDGAVPIDNNVSEREMKRVVLNRNYVQFWIMRSSPVSSGITALKSSLWQFSRCA